MEVSLPFFLAPLLIGLVSLVLFFSLSSAGGRKSDGRRLPPSPPGCFPVLGHLPLLGSLPHRKLQAMAATVGPVMLVRLGRVPAVVVSSAAAAKEALKTHDLAVSSRPGGPMIDRLMYGGYGVAFAPYGEGWRQARRVLVLHLLTQRAVLSFRRLREQEAAALVARVRAGGGVGVNLGDALISYTSSVLLHAAFGDDDSSYGLDGGRKLRDVFADFQELVGSGTLGELVPWLAWVDTLRGVHAKAARTFEALDGLLERAIADRRQRRSGGGRRETDGGGDGTPRNYVDVLLDVSEAEEEAGGTRIDTVAIKGILMDIFIGGTDTTSTTMEFAMAQLINHPDKLRRLQEEIRAVVGDDDRVTEDHLDKLSYYLESVIKESQRLHPPGAVVARETIEDFELLGYGVPRQTRVIINAWAIGRDPATWERADEFLPERFTDQDMVGQDFTSLPFGHGRRGCPGAGFSMPNIKLVLTSLLYHFDWELPAGEALKVDMNEKYGLAIRLKKPLRLVAKPWSISKKATFPEEASP
ncbi:unnamed protein product [Urochloa humidicola]